MTEGENTLTVRAANAADAQFVEAAEQKYIDCPWTLEQIESEIKNPNAVFLVAEQNGNRVGYASGVIVAGECEISNIAVVSEYRRRGVGRTLMHALICQAKKRGAGAVFLLVRSDNTPAIALYNASGFAEVGIRKNYYKGDKNALIMRLDL
ncbi:MAG: ribosomal protein S18-alanine N-acetyltransferase [Clostridiales bacterium]|nr:ribosomal protein S18-alanine N-acetyltransferase [Clostridiales bacterium]